MAINSVNYDHPLPDISQPFQIICNPDTDLWEKPPNIHSFNAPIIYQTLTIASFKSARITVSADWKHKYDQGGLCIIIAPREGPRRWVKTGIECLNDEYHVSTVATDNWSDWSLRPTAEKGSKTATIELEEINDGALWVHVIAEDGSKLPCREIAWWADLPKDTECWVGPYAAKPAKENEQLVVSFKDFAISTK